MLNKAGDRDLSHLKKTDDKNDTIDHYLKTGELEGGSPRSLTENLNDEPVSD